jgi:hypothetical protein
MPEIILGSGDLYLEEYDGEAIPEDSAIEVEANKVGDISGGASLEYKPTLYEVEDDNNKVHKRMITKEEVTFKSGILTFLLENLAKLAHSEVEDDAVNFKKTIKIGGKKTLTNYVLQFVHTKDDGLKLRIRMVATAGDGFTLSFTKDKETVTDATFKALSQTDGTLVEIIDEYDAA